MNVIRQICGRHLRLQLVDEFIPEARNTVGAAFFRKASTRMPVTEVPGSNPAKPSIGLGGGQTALGFFCRSLRGGSFPSFSA